MKLIFDNEDFEAPILQKLAEACNTEKEKISIYLNSRGGRVSVLKALLHIINSNPERFELVGFHNLSSCAFEFYMKAKCKKEILEGTIGMYHLGVTELNYTDKMKLAYDCDIAVVERKKKYHLPEIKQLMKDCEFTKKETKKILEGQDLYFQFDRLKQMEAAYIKNVK